jgi:hypothetical protein
VYGESESNGSIATNWSIVPDSHDDMLLVSNYQHKEMNKDTVIPKSAQIIHYMKTVCMVIIQKSKLISISLLAKFTEVTNSSYLLQQKTSKKHISM